MTRPTIYRWGSVIALIWAATVLGQEAPAAREDSYVRLAGTMTTAATMLEGGTTGPATTEVQADVVRQLDALIALHEQAGSGGRSVQGEGEPRSQKPSGATGAPLKPAEESVLGPSGWAPGASRAAIDDAGTWLPGLPPAEQKKVTETFSAGKLPPRYREVLRQYNRRLAEQEGE